MKKEQNQKTDKLTDTTVFGFFSPQGSFELPFCGQEKTTLLPPMSSENCTHKNGLSPSALPPAIQWHFESKLVSIRSLMWCQQARYSPQGTKIIVDELAERSPEREITQKQQILSLALYCEYYKAPLMTEHSLKCTLQIPLRYLNLVITTTPAKRPSRVSL